MKMLGVSREAYFALPLISNSHLSKVKGQLNTGAYKVPMNEAALSFGSLVDAILTQPQDTDVTHPDYKFALQMSAEFLRDPFCKSMHELAEKQTVYTDTFEWTYNGDISEADGKCLYDFDLSERAGADLKTVSAHNYKQFLSSVDMFDWDRQAVFYMTVSGKTKHSILGLSKKKIQPPFILHINKGDEWWWKGREKMMELLWHNNLA